MLCLPCSKVSQKAHLLFYPTHTSSLLTHFVAHLCPPPLQVSSPGKSLNLYPSNEYEVLPNGCEAHWEVVERILFIYAKLNPGIAYVQGMNEIVGPIYYTFATDPNDDWKGKEKIIHLFILALRSSWLRRPLVPNSSTLLSE